MTDEQFQFVALQLARQTELLEILVQALVPEEAEESDECQHPDDSRVSLATPANPEHWICKDCRFENHGVTRN